MKTENEMATWLNVKGKDRVVLAIFCPILTIVIMLISVGAWQRLPSPDLLLKVIKSILLETFTAIALLGAIVSAWVIAKPNWARNLLENQIKKTLLWSFLMSGVILIVVFLSFRAINYK